MIDLKKAYLDSSLYECEHSDTYSSFFKESLVDLKGMQKLASLTNRKNKFIISNIDSRGKVVFSVNPNEVAKNVSIEDIKYLIKCGILYDCINDYFYMYV